MRRNKYLERFQRHRISGTPLESNEMIRLVICLTVIWLALGRSAAADVTYPIHVKDALDRDVTITSQPKSVLLGSGFN